MSQMSSSGSAVPNPAPQAAEQASRVARYDKDPSLVKPDAKGWDKIMDSDPRAKDAMKSLFESKWLQPGMGLGTPTYSPRAGAEREQQRKMAQGASAAERMKILTDAGVTDREGMVKVFNRAYARPNKAFMMAKGR